MTDKPPKLKVDTTIIHFIDGKEVRCSFNSCRDKFVPIEYDRSYRAWSHETNSFDSKRKIQAKRYSWQCKECGSKYADRQQNSKSKKAYIESFNDDLLGRKNSILKREDINHGNKNEQ